MKRFISAAFVLALVFGFGGVARAADAKDATAAIDKAIKAMGGEEKLAAIKAASWKTKGKLSINGEDNNFNTTIVVQGIDHLRQEIEAEFGGNSIKGLTILAGDKGWRQFGDMSMPLDEAALANDRRSAYLQLVAVNPTLLKDKAFKIDSAADEQVGDKKAITVKVIGPDAKDFTISFDKESGLPIRMVGKVATFQGDEVTQETTLEEYKDFGGIKKATKLNSKHDGQKFLDQQVSDFKVMDKADAAAFAEPK